MNIFNNEVICSNIIFMIDKFDDLNNLYMVNTLFRKLLNTKFIIDKLTSKFNVYYGQYNNFEELNISFSYFSHNMEDSYII
jgi:hypothetical protein